MQNKFMEELAIVQCKYNKFMKIIIMMYNITIMDNNLFIVWFLILSYINEYTSTLEYLRQKYEAFSFVQEENRRVIIKINFFFFLIKKI